MESKQEVRKALVAKLLALTAEELQKRSLRICTVISNLPIYIKATVIMGYYPLKGEVDVLGLLSKALGQKKVCFPVMDMKTKQLRVFEVQDFIHDFVKGPYGVMEPDTARCREIPLGDIDVCLIPGVGFDRGRNRLGRGAGFYDRFLKNLKPAAGKVGVGFDFQVCPDLPVDPLWDVTLDCVVTEQFVIS